MNDPYLLHRFGEQSPSYEHDLSHYGSDTLQCVDNWDGLQRRNLFTIPHVTKLTTYTYGGFCAGWKFTYNDTREFDHYIFDDTNGVPSGYTETVYTLDTTGSQEHINGMYAYADTATTSELPVSAYEFRTSSGNAYSCGSKAAGAARRVILSPNANRSLLSTNVCIYNPVGTTQPHVVTTQAWYINNELWGYPGADFSYQGDG